jgi:hypothetical protein
MPSHTFRKLFVQLANETYAKWEFLEKGDAMFQRHHIVPDLTEVFWTPAHNCAGLGCQQFAKCGLRSFDPA